MTFVCWWNPWLINCSDLPHSADPAEIEDLEQFLAKVLPAEGDGQTSAGL